MTMKKESQGNMYPWAKPWNPLGGKCPHDCSYCSTNSLRRYPIINEKYSGELGLTDSLFKLPKKEERMIFVCAQNDLFAKDVPDIMIKMVLHQCLNHPQHKYFFQTKNPFRYATFLSHIPKGSILCTTIETNRWYPEIMRAAPYTDRRALGMNRIDSFEKEVTIEPILDFDLDEMVSLIRFCNPTKVNIGADSKNNHLPEPSKKKLLALSEELKKFTVIDRKTNLERLLNN